MRNIRTFETYEDFLASQEAVSGSGKYVEDIIPGYAYIRDRYMAGESGYTFFNKPSGYIFGDIIYTDDGSQLKSVYWSDWNDSLGTPIGLVVIPESMAPDGNARMIALTDLEISGGGPKSGGEKGGDVLKSYGPSGDMVQATFSWYSGNQNSDDLNWYDIYAGNNISEDPVVYLIAAGNMLGAMSTDNSGVTANPIADGEYYTSIVNNCPPVVSPYMTESDEINPYYLQEVWASGQIEPSRSTKDPVIGAVYNALSDFSGLTWTRLLVNTQDAYYSAQQYSTSGTSAGNWYVPSLGEAGFLQARYFAIESILHNTFENSEYNAYYSLNSNEARFTSTLFANSGTYKGQEIPYLFYFEDEGSNGGGIMASVNPTRSSGLKASYPSDIPGEPFGGLNFGLTTYDSRDPQSVDTYAPYVRPMAMIKDGHIVSEAGLPESNNHQVKDLPERLATFFIPRHYL